MPFGEFQIHVSNYSKHVFPKGQVPVGGIPESARFIDFRLTTCSNLFKYKIIIREQPGLCFANCSKYFTCPKYHQRDKPFFWNSGLMFAPGILIIFMILIIFQRDG